MKQYCDINMKVHHFSRVLIDALDSNASLITKCVNPLSPRIDFYVDLLICASSWASNHKFILLSKIFQETYYL